MFESADPTPKGLAGVPFIAVEIANGVVQAIVLDQTIASGNGSTRVYSGRLALDP